MLKKFSLFCAVCLAFIVSAAPLAKVQSDAVIVAYGNLSDIIKYPMVQQFLASTPLPPEININDFDGKIAAGCSFADDITKSKSFAFNVILCTKKPTAGKLFKLISAEALKSGAKQIKVGGKTAVGDDEARVILVSPKEVILQVRSGKYQFTDLKKGKNLLTARPEVKNSTLVVAVNTQAFSKMFMKKIDKEDQEIKELLTGQKFAVGSLKLKADGGLSFAHQMIYANAAGAKKTLAIFEKTMAELKQDPMAAAILEKVTIAAKGNIVTTQGNFSAADIQGLIAQIMMMVGKMNVPAAK